MYFILFLLCFLFSPNSLTKLSALIPFLSSKFSDQVEYLTLLEEQVARRGRGKRSRKVTKWAAINLFFSHRSLPVHNTAKLIFPLKLGNILD